MVVLDSMWKDMFALGAPAPEKILRTILVYAGIVLIVRVFGKRLMAQMNSLDLVVVLLLSNVVQNAIIGDDNSVTGALIGAATLVIVNWLLDMAEHRFPALRGLLEGSSTTIVKDGEVDGKNLDAMGITRKELDIELHTQGADRADEVKLATLEPGGNLLVNLKREDQNASYGDLVEQLRQLRAHVDARLDAAGIPAAPAAGQKDQQ